jgi:uncharacterized protein with WD repeat
MEKIRIGLVGAENANGDRYYFTKARVPAQLDLTDSVIHAFPWENDSGEFGLDITIRRYNPDHKKQQRTRK